MKIKTTLLKLVTAGIDAFLLLFAFMLTMGLTSSVHEHSLFFFKLRQALHFMRPVSLFLSLVFIYFVFFI